MTTKYDEADEQVLNETDEAEDLPRRKMSALGASMERGAFPPEQNVPQTMINGLWYYDKAPDLDAIIHMFEQHIWPNHRFHSLMDDGYWQPINVMTHYYHFEEVAVDNEAAIHSYVQQAILEPLDESFPPWKLILLRGRPPNRSALLFRLHHSITDGLGLIIGLSPLIGCEGGDLLSKVPLPRAVLPPSVAKKAKEKKAKEKKNAKDSQASSSSCASCVYAPFSFCQGASVVLCAQHDSEIVLNAPLADRSPFVVFNGQRVYTRLPAIPMADVKRICKKHNCTVNDVLMAALTGALRHYGGDVRGDKQLMDGGPELDFTALVLLGLPRPMDESDLMTAMHNNILFASCSLPIDEETPYDRLFQVVQVFENLKSKPYMAGLSGLTQCLSGGLPASVLQKAASETFSKHSLVVSNVPGPMVPCTFPKDGGELIKEVQVVIHNVIPQVSFISYNGFVYGNLVADPQLYPEPAVFGNLFAAEFTALEQCEAA